MRFIRRKPASPVQNSIHQVILRLETIGPEDENYERHQAQLKEHYALLAEDRPQKLSPDVAVGVGANLLGILAVLHFEKANVVLSKAWTSLYKSVIK